MCGRRTLTQRIRVRMDERLHDRLCRYARRRGMTVSDAVRWAVLVMVERDAAMRAGRVL